MTLFWALVTGLSWTAIGIVLSRCARNDFDVAAYSIIQAISACLLCLLFYADFHADFSFQNYLPLGLVILSAAAINAFAQFWSSMRWDEEIHLPYGQWLRRLCSSLF